MTGKTVGIIINILFGLILGGFFLGKRPYRFCMPIGSFFIHNRRLNREDYGGFRS